MKPIGYQILEIGKLFKEDVKKKAEKDGIPSTWFQILRVLRHKDNEITQKEICEETNMKAPTISIALANMESEGLIIRKRDAIDNRRIFVYLTNEGLNISKNIHNYFIQSDSLLENSVTKEELDIFYLCLSKMKEVLSND